MRITPTWRHHVRAKRRLQLWVKRLIARQSTAMTVLPPKALRLVVNNEDHVSITPDASRSIDWTMVLLIDTLD
jgi:hypothetical protein